MPRHATAPAERPQGRVGARWARRSVIALLIVTLVVPLTGLLAINLSLWTGLVGRWVSGERPRSTVRLDYGWAWCVWPTEVHVRDLRLEIDAARWQLAVDVPEGTVDVDLLALADRHFDARSIRGEGVALAFAFKRPHGADAEEYAEFPRIDGFPAPVLDEPPRPIPPEDEAWRIDLRDVDADLVHLRVNGLDGDLRGRLRGALEVTVGHRFALPRVDLAIDEGSIRRGDAVLLDEVAGRLDAALAAYDPEAIQGREALRQLDVALTIDAHTPGLGWIAGLGVELPATIRGGAGSISASVGVDDGALIAGSEAHLRAHRLQLRRRVGDGAIALTGSARIDAAIPEGGRGPRVSAVMRKLEARDVGGDEPWLRADTLEARAAFASADLVDGFGRVIAWRAALPEFTADLGASSRLGEVGVRTGRLAGHASAERGDDAKEIDLDLAVDVDGLSLRRGGLAIAGGGYLRSAGHVHRGDHQLDLGPIHAKLRGLRVDTERGHTEGSWVEIDRATIDYDWERERLRVGARGKLAELRQLLAHVRPGEDVFERVPGLSLARHAVDFSLTLTRTPRSMRVDVDALKGGPIDLVAAIGRAGDELRGAVYLRGARVGVLTAGEGSRTIKLAVEPEWFDEKVAWVRGVGE